MLSNERSDIHVYDYWHILRKRKGIAVISFIAVITVVLFINQYQKPLYLSSVELLVDKNQPEVIDSSRNLFSIWDETYLRTQFKLMRSRALVEKAVDALLKDEGVDKKELFGCYFIPIKKNQFTENQKNALIAKIRGSISPETVGKTRFLRIKLSGGDGEMTAVIANAIGNAYLEMYKDSQAAQSQQRFIFVTEKLRNLRYKIKIGELALTKLEKEEKLAELLKEYKEMYPEVVSLRAEIKALEEGLAAKLNPSSDEIADYTISNRTILEQEIATDREMHKLLLQRTQEMNVLASSMVSVSEPAWPSRIPVRPKKSLNLLFGCLVGISLGTGLAFFREYLDNSIRNSDDVKKYMDLPLLGVIPSVNPGKGSWNTESIGYLRGLSLLDEKPKREILESYRSFRTNLELSHPEVPKNTLLVTSSIEKEGKSTIAVNLAISLTQTGKKVLVVESDLRRPVFNKRLGLDRKTGLTQILLGECGIDEVAFENPRENLYVLCSGQVPKNSTELIASNRMKEFIRASKEKFDIVIFDSPPVKAVTDAVLLASQVDGVIFVIEAGRTPRTVCSDAKSILDRARPRMMGAVLNNVDVHAQDSYYHYYSHYQE